MASVGPLLEPVWSKKVRISSRQVSGWAASQVLNAYFSVIANSRDGPVLTGVRSMTTVTYLSPLRVCRRRRPATSSKRPGWSVSRRWPSARTASLAVCHATPRVAAIRLMDRRLTTKASSAHRNTPPDRQERGYAALVKSWRQTRPQPVHRQRRSRTRRMVERQPDGTRANSRGTLPRGCPWQPQRWHQPSDSTGRHSRVARSRLRRRPATTRPRPPRRQNVARPAGT